MPRNLSQYWSVLFLLSTACLADSPVAALKTAPVPPPIATLADKPLSERVVAYQIDARFDPAKHTVDATEVLTYHNLTGQPQDTFPFHLYLNAFNPTSTFMKEGHRDRSTFLHWKDKYKSSAEVKSLAVEGIGDLTSQIKFISPDDGNPDDRTVFQVKLPRAIAPNESVQFKIAFHDQFGQVVARTGYDHNFMMGAQWFPKVGVWWQGAWNCHQYHATTEFFADFGVYDVKLTVPQYEVIGASGVEVSNVNNPNNTKTVTYHGDDIHDFAWTVSPRYKVKDDGVFQGQMGPVKLQILMQPAHWSQVERHEKILKETLDHFERWYGPYPYKTLTLVDPEPDSAAGGMEYPTFITGGTSWFAPKGLHLEPEEV